MRSHWLIVAGLPNIRESILRNYFDEQFNSIMMIKYIWLYLVQTDNLLDDKTIQLGAIQIIRDALWGGGGYRKV